MAFMKNTASAAASASNNASAQSKAPDARVIISIPTVSGEERLGDLPMWDNNIVHKQIMELISTPEGVEKLKQHLIIKLLLPKSDEQRKLAF